MKKLIYDEMNIKDIINHVNLNLVLYTTDSTKLAVGVPLDNVIMLEYDGKTSLDLAELSGLDHFQVEYVVLSISKVEDGKRYICLKKIQMLELPS